MAPIGFNGYSHRQLQPFAPRPATESRLVILRYLIAPLLILTSTSSALAKTIRVEFEAEAIWAQTFAGGPLDSGSRASGYWLFEDSETPSSRQPDGRGWKQSASWSEFVIEFSDMSPPFRTQSKPLALHYSDVPVHFDFFNPPERFDESSGIIPLYSFNLTGDGSALTLPQFSSPVYDGQWKPSNFSVNLRAVSRTPIEIPTGDIRSPEILGKGIDTVLTFAFYIDGKQTPEIGPPSDSDIYAEYRLTSLHVVPEPATMGLLLFAMVAVGAGRRTNG